MHLYPKTGASPPLEPDSSLDTAGIREPLTHAEMEFARELFETHRGSIYRYLNGLVRSREEAGEILQETYLRVLRQPDFEPLRNNARAYLFQTATNLARDLFRRRASQRLDPGVEAASTGFPDTIDWSSWPEFELEAEQVAEKIVSVLRGLDKPVRNALLLHRFRDMTHKEIASRLGVSERTIERYIKEGLTAVSRRLEIEP